MATKKEDRPEVYDPEWTDHVLEHLRPEELNNGKPTSDGLRRVLEMLLGPILYCVPEPIQIPSQENGFRAAARCLVRFRNKAGEIEEWGDGADLYQDNCPSRDFLPFATATACTRAKARALKGALRLDRRVVTSEEVSPLVPIKEKNFITEFQLNAVSNLCGKQGINALAFLKSFGGLKFTTVEEIPYATAQAMVGRLNEYQQKKVPIPDAIRGFDPKWRE